MSNYDINKNPALVNLMIQNEKEADRLFYKKHPDALTPLFERELRELGFEFEVPSQINGFLPKHKEIILPIVIRYYKMATIVNEKWFFCSLFHFRGFDEVIPMLLEDYYAGVPRRVCEMITECLYVYRSKKYINDYLDILSNPRYYSQEYGCSVSSVIELVSKLKVDNAIPIFTKMLNNEELAVLGIRALGNYKREDFRPYFERFENDKNTFVRKSARSALKKLG